MLQANLLLILTEEQANISVTLQETALHRNIVSSSKMWLCWKLYLYVLRKIYP